MDSKSDPLQTSGARATEIHKIWDFGVAAHIGTPLVDSAPSQP